MKRYFSHISRFFKEGYSESVKTTAAAFFILALVGYLAAFLFPDFTNDYVERTIAMLTESGIVEESGAISFELVLANNISVCFMSALYGFIPFIYLSAYPLGSNAALMGLMAGYYQQNGISLSLYALSILPHGIIEIPAMILTFALGLQLCRNFTQNLKTEKKLPGNNTSKQLILDFLRIFFTLILPLILASAALEVYVTPQVVAAAM
ncbi:MAG: stage II sporulation protein M [Oscillospiraceae bacterium]|nr:stage II sporulation protein M [Oscillospiraceae bacterium]